MKTRVLLLALVAVLGFALAAPAQIAGFKISEPTFDNFTPTGADATFDVIAYGNTTSPGSSVAGGLGLDNTSATAFTQSLSHGYGSRPYHVAVGVRSDWQVVTYNSGIFDFTALDYGDGNKRGTIHLALDPVSEGNHRGGTPPNTFRGTFTHTYADGNFTIRAQLTPSPSRAIYGAMSAGVDAESVLSTGTRVEGSMNVEFEYMLNINPVSPLPPPYMGNSYTAMVTTYLYDTWAPTIIAVENHKDIMVEAVVPEITATGSCPGMATITVGNLTPGERVSMWLSDAAGSFMIPGGRCAGTTIDLATTEPAWRRTANGSGEIVFMRNISGQHCSLMLQALDHDSCVKTAVIDVATLVGGP